MRGREALPTGAAPVSKREYWLCVAVALLILVLQAFSLVGIEVPFVQFDMPMNLP
jgi:hypothetical protein